LRWPVWSAPVTLATVRTLLGLDIADIADRTEFERRGILAVYKSRRVPLNKDYATFQFPEVVWATE
jgi:hypothetical protein